MSNAKKPETESSTEYAKVARTSGSVGSRGEAEPLPRNEYVTTEHFVAHCDDARGTIAIFPTGWVGDPALVISVTKLNSLKELVNLL